MSKVNFGFVLLILVLASATYFLILTNIDTSRLIVFSVLGFFVSFGFILGDRIVSIKTTLWEIQTASQQAHDNAKEVEEILLEVQNHKERIDKIAEESEEMKRQISEVADEAQAAKISVDAFLLAYRDVERRKRLNKSMGR